jgi:hypothetical protein
MKTILGSRKAQSLVRLSVFLILAASIAGMVGCDGDGYTPPSKDLEIRTWYDLDAVRDNLAGNHTLMNDLNSTTLGYEELASPTANGGKGWQPIGIYHPHGPTAYTGFMGTFDGQGYEICDLYINRPNEDSSVGLFMDVDDGVIEDIGVTNVTVIGENGVGALAGCIMDGAVRNSYSTGSVTGNDDVGGLVGRARCVVIDSYFAGSVNGYEYIGGLVAENFGTVRRSYFTGNVTGSSFVGGLVGANYQGTLDQSYSSGNVTGYEHVGGLVGGNTDTVSNSFWDTQTSGQATSAGGTGKTTAQMKNIATFSGAGWNIVAVGGPGERNPAYIWNIVNNVTYPFLSWQP